jgi:predicted acylesterase/phospholipase RssA
MIKLAITISGAVSLGAYEAGVMYELLRGLKAHNEDPASTNERIVIDVLAGASAGGMTAAIVAQKLLYEPAALDDPSDPAHNALYTPWVTEIDLKGLLQMEPSESTANSLFSSNLITKIAESHLLQRYASSPPTPSAARHSAAADSIRLGLAMSNLSGIDYGRGTYGGGPNFEYTRFQDELRSTLDATSDQPSIWKQISSAAVACGAFPFAFRVQELLRSKSDYAQRGPVDYPPTNFQYVYTDGGLFQNEPLGLAKNLVDEIDPNHRQTESRRFVFVAPNLRSSVMDGGTFIAKNATMVNTAKRLVTALFNQAQYQDWVTVEKTNEKINSFNNAAGELLRAMLTNRITPGSLTAASDALLNLLYPNLGDRSAAATRLRNQFSDDYTRLMNLPTGGGALADEWLNTIVVLERIGGVQDHDEMMILPVTASDQELAGSCLFHFGGFFDKEYRNHDYLVGRQKARQFLQGGALGIVRNIPTDPIAPKPQYVDVKPKDLPQQSRLDLRNTIEQRADGVMKALGMSPPVRWAIKTWEIRPKLNAWLGL